MWGNVFLGLLEGSPDDTEHAVNGIASGNPSTGNNRSIWHNFNFTLVSVFSLVQAVWLSLAAATLSSHISGLHALSKYFKLVLKFRMHALLTLSLMNSKIKTISKNVCRFG